MGCCMSTTRKPDPDPPLSPAKPEPSTVPPPEEETVVKEVLSETPTPKPPVPNPTQEKPIVEIEKKVNADVSEASDVCSVSESASTVPEEYSSEIRRSPAKIRRTHNGNVPVRRPCPPKRVGSLPGRERNAISSARRDSGDISGRRSRSPAMRSAEMGGAKPGPSRIPSTRKSPGRVRSEDPTRGKEMVAPTESLENPLVSLECFIFL